ncbi:MAG: phosphoribosylformylglycinamidine cyclo-ligase [Phycisphaerales bacterium]
MPPRDEKTPLTYAQAGVSIDAGDDFARRIRAHMRRTHGPRVITNDGGFAGLLRLDFNESLFRRNYKDPVLVACTDGVGTKVKLASQLKRWRGLGQDLVAMNVNDLVVEGAEPLLFLDYIATGKLEPDALEQIVAGACDACARCGAALLGGETAEMPDVYAPGELDLAGFAVGVVELSRAMDAARVEPGDIVLGLASDGVHANGFSLVRRILEHADLDPTQIYPEVDPELDLGDVLLAPTRLYAAPVVRVLRRYTVKRVVTGMAHITGGGLADNLARALPANVRAVIDSNAWQPPPVFDFLQQHGDIETHEMQRVFNMGIGFCLIVRPTFAASIQRRLTRFGERVATIGVIEPGDGDVTLR